MYLGVQSSRSLARLASAINFDGSPATWADDFGDGMSGHFATRLHNLSHTGAMSRAKVDAQTFTRLELFECPKVRIAQIVDVDVIANAGPIGRCVVITKDR